MRWSRVADYCFCAFNLPAGWSGRKARKIASVARETFFELFLAEFCFGRRNGLFFEMDEHCSSVIAVKCQGTR
jgi:hypothetical protein